MGAAYLIVLILAAIAFSFGGILIAKIFVKGTKNPQKGQAYECGIPSDGSPWNQFNVGYYLFALIFLIFDVELVFMYPWAVVVKQVGMPAVVVKQVGMPALFEIIVFFFILFMGFLYAHKKGALKWI
ncbi:MAG: NADH-quinone oxidoreductase subunit A [Bacteroidetes bacterium]|nr:NADH-quinone oxidoreductase subunit A [Bacteroidota bacterium]